MNYDGAHAERFRVPILSLHVYPDTMSWEERVLIEPLAAAIQAFELTSIASSVQGTVLGVGRLGLLICAVTSRNNGEVWAVFRSQAKLERALTWGAAEAIDASQRNRLEAA